jgi:hypothetical protein
MAFTLSSNGSLGITTSISPQVFTPSFSIPEGYITFGTHTFTADQLGELLSKLLIQYPELSI